MCDFSISFDEPINTELIERVKAAIISNNGSFEGNETKGSYILNPEVGQIIGSYKIENNSIVFKITKKPWLVGCFLIKEKFKYYLTLPN